MVLINRAAVGYGASQRASSWRCGPVVLFEKKTENDGCAVIPSALQLKLAGVTRGDVAVTMVVRGGCEVRC